jgi:hypothetical protein
MTIRMQHARNEIKSHLLTNFTENLMPELMRNPQVTSLYGGVSPGLGIDYVARLSCDLNSISQLQSRLHELAEDSRILIDITVYIIHKQLSRLSLSRAVLVTNLPKQVKLYRDRRIIPYLANEERVRLLYYPAKEQQDFINQFHSIDEALEEINYLELEANEREILLRSLVEGLLNKNIYHLKEVHALLHAKVERQLTDIIREISEKEFAKFKTKDNIPSQKVKSQLSYTERIKIVTSHFEETASSNEALIVVKALNSTIKIRNAFAHAEFERVSIEECIESLVEYCRFIRGWNNTH